MSFSLAAPAVRHPSFTLPLSFLGFGALNFLLLNGVFVLGLPSIATAWLRNPVALLVTHLFTLGYVTAIIMGAVYQLVPVILETSLWSEKLGYAHLACYVTGVVTLLAGFWKFIPSLLAFGGSLVLTGVVLFVVNTAATMRTAKHWHHSATFSMFSLGSILGLLLALNVRTGFFGASTIRHLISHVILGFGGWFTLTIMGVAGLATVGGFDAPRGVLAACLDVGIVGVGLFISEMHRVIHSRVRKELDPGVRFAQVSFLFLVVVMSLALVYLIIPGDYATPARAVGLLYAVGMGWISLMVVGQMYKIIPFLVWTTRYAPKAGKEKVPMLRDMYDNPCKVGVLHPCGRCGHGGVRTVAYVAAPGCGRGCPTHHRRHPVRVRDVDHCRPVGSSPTECAVK